MLALGTMWTKFHPSYVVLFQEKCLGHRLPRPTRNPILWWMPSHGALPYTPTPPPNYCGLAFRFLSFFSSHSASSPPQINPLFEVCCCATLELLRTQDFKFHRRASEPPDSQLLEWHKFWVTKKTLVAIKITLGQIKFWVSEVCGIIKWWVALSQFLWKQDLRFAGFWEPVFGLGFVELRFWVLGLRCFVETNRFWGVVGFVGESESSSVRFS